MSILSVDTISPIGSGTTVTLNATETKVNNFITVGTGASISSPSSNVLTLGTNSTEKLRITSAGKIGIGQVAPSSLLTIKDETGGQSLLIEGSGGNDVIVLGSVNGATNRGELILKEGTTGDAYVKFSSKASTPNFIINNNLGIGTGDNVDAKLKVRTAGVNQTMFTLEADMGTNNNRTLYIKSPTTDSNSEPFTFHTGNSIQFMTDANIGLKIHSDGKVGIGTDNPERTMDVKGSNCMIQLEGTGGSGKQWSLCSADNTTGAAVGTAGMFAIYNDTDGVAALRITNANYVLKPKLPYFYATATPTAGSPNIHSFGNVHGNNGNHYNNSNGRFTAPVDGFYWFAAGIWCNSANNQTGAHLQLMRYIQSSSSTTAFAGANHVTQYNQLPLSGGTFMTSGDYVYLHQTGIAIQGSTPRNYFSGYLVG